MQTQDDFNETFNWSGDDEYEKYENVEDEAEEDEAAEDEAEEEEVHYGNLYYQDGSMDGAHYRVWPNNYRWHKEHTNANKMMITPVEIKNREYLWWWHLDRAMVQGDPHVMFVTEEVIKSEPKFNIPDSFPPYEAYTDWKTVPPKAPQEEIPRYRANSPS